MSALLAAATAVLVAAVSALDPQLVGTWALDGEAYMVLEPEGTGRMTEGPVRWTAAAGILSVVAEDGNAERAHYRVAGDVLTLALGSGEMRLTRIRRSPPEREKRTAAPVTPQAAPATRRRGRGGRAHCFPRRAVQRAPARRR